MPNVLNILVETFDKKTDEVTFERTINFNNKVYNDWLLKHLIWCFYNNHGVTLIPTDKPVDKAQDRRDT